MFPRWTLPALIWVNFLTRAPDQTSSSHSAPAVPLGASRFAARKSLPQDLWLAVAQGA